MSRTQATCLSISVPPLDFRSILLGHGWIFLAPNTLGADQGSFSRWLRLRSGSRVQLHVSYNHKIHVRVVTELRLTSQDRQDVKRACRVMLRLDEDLSEFHDLCGQHQYLAWTGQSHGGRLLRSPTPFEDVVKTICTTNCSWSNTKLMVAALCDGLDPCFPDARQIAEAGVSFLRNHVRAGYRSEYIYEFALRVLEGDLDPDSWLATPHSDATLNAVRSIRGVGPYACNHILMMLGRYDRIPVDSEVLSWLRKTFHRGRAVSEQKAVQRFAAFGRWQYLAYKCERIARRSNYIN